METYIIKEYVEKRLKYLNNFKKKQLQSYEPLDRYDIEKSVNSKIKELKRLKKYISNINY